MKNIFEPGRVTRVVGFGAHPDDLEVGAGGLLARMARSGADVTLCVVSLPNEMDRRIAEAREGARILGAKVIVLYEKKQCRVEDLPMHELVAKLDGVIGDLRPDLVLTHSANDLHWDHGLVHRATISSLRRSPCDLLAYLSSYEMNAQTRSIGQCFADVSTTIDTKVAAIAAHQSQLAKMDLDSTRDLARATGRQCGVPYAESYEVLRMRI